MIMNITLSAEHKKNLETLGVLAVYLFGSQAEGFATPHSDVDIGVVFNQPLPDDTLKLYDELYGILGGIIPGRQTDIVLAERGNLELKKDMITHGKILFDV